MEGLWLNIAIIGVFVAVAALLYHFVVRPWHLRWGTIGNESTRLLPGDALALGTDVPVTHAVGINAAAKDVWPWIVQIGQRRGGFYSYTWLENLFGCRITNANTIVPHLRKLEVGDEIWLHPNAVRCVRYPHSNRTLTCSNRTARHAGGLGIRFAYGRARTKANRRIR